MTKKSTRTASGVMAALCLAGGIYCLIDSIKGNGNWPLAIGLFLIAVGNLVILFGNKAPKEK